MMETNGYDGDNDIEIKKKRQKNIMEMIQD